MKGLLIKDFQLIKSQKQFLGAFVFMSIIFTLYNDNTIFTTTYMAIMLSFVSISTISFDQHANGMSFLLTLPVSRSDYAKEKYLLMLLITGASLITSFLFISIRFFLKYFPLEEGQLFEALLTSVVGTVLIHSIMIPISLKFEAEKNRIALMVVMGAAYAVGFVCVSLIRHFNIDVDALMQKVNSVSAGTILFVTMVIMIVISFLISLRIIKKKDF